MGKGGGGQPTQTNSNVTNTNVPEYARPYVENMLGATQQQLFKMDGNNITGFQPYKAYGGTYDEAGNQTAYDPSKAIAGFSPMQQQAQRGIGNMQLPGEFGTAASSTQQAMQQALGANYAPSNYGSQFNPQGIGYDAQTMQGYQMGPAERVSTQSFAEPGSASAYMSPYMQNVVEIQKREAQRQSGIQGTQQQAQATQAGAFGGSRDAIMRAERERNLGQQMGDIQAQGSQAAFQQAQQQFNAEQQARLSAQQANQQAGITVGQQNLGAAQQTGLANQAALNQAGQFNAGQNLQAASLGAQYGQAANQLNEQSRQYGAGYGMQGLQTGMQGASQLANIGNQGLQAQQGIYGLQNQMGQQQQQNQQQIINQSMQDYANAQQYPLMQLGTMSNMLRGLPMQSQTTQQYQAQANPITQGIGAIGALGSLAQMRAKGGVVKGMASGGITSVPRYDVGGAVMSDLIQKEDAELAKEAKESPSPKVREMAAAILKQRQAGMDAKPQMAGGGIIAFQKGKTVDADEVMRQADEMGQSEMDRIANQAGTYVDRAQADAAAKAAAGSKRVQMDAKTDPRSVLAAAPVASNSTLVERQPNETFEQFRQREIRAQAAAQAQKALAAQDQAERERLAELAKRREAGQIPRVSPYVDATKLPNVGSARSKTLSQDDMRAMSGTENSSGIKTVAPIVGAGKRVQMDAKTDPRSVLAATPTDAEPTKKRSLTTTPQAAPVIDKGAAPATAVVDRAPPALLDRNAPAYTGPAAEAAPTGIAAVDPLADSRATLKNLQAEANKTQEQIYKENLAAMKAQGLDTSEARDQYMKAQQAQRAETEKSFQNREYLRRAEFFASWGSTPGNTLVAGMAALKKTIPDMIQDTTDKRAALQQADKAIYELGEAVRLEKLGMWEKAAAQKLKAAETAATLQGQLTQAAASIRGQEIGKEGTLGAAEIRAKADKETTQMTVDASKYVADQRLQGDKAAAAASARATAEAAAGRLNKVQFDAINNAAGKLSLLPSELEKAHNNNPDYVTAIKAKATAERILANNPDSASAKAQLANAQKTISGYTRNDGDIIRAARQRLEAMERRYYGPDYVPSPVAPAEADPLGLRKSK